MNETRRQFYLQQCGITLWYSQRPLPGAAPSVAFEFFPNEDDEPAPLPGAGLQTAADAATDRQPSVAARSTREHLIPAQQKSTLHQVVASAMPARKAVELKPLEQDAALTGAKAQIRVEARLAVDLRILASGDLLVIAQLGKDLPAGVQEQLLLRIARALGRPLTSETMQALAWPVFSNARVPGNDNAGITALLERVLEPQRSKTWLGLGAEVQALVKVMGRGGAPCTTDGARLYFESDLGALATSGHLKRKLWNMLRGSAALAPGGHQDAG